MANLFQVSEIVNIGIEDEVTGVALYTTLADKTEDEGLKAFYGGQADVEREHERTFRDLYAQVEKHPISETYPGEYESYLRALLDSRAFPTPAVAIQKANSAADDRSGLELVLQMEKDTLTLFHEIVKLIPERHRPVVQEIIDEERAHVVAVTEQLRQQA